MFLSLNKEDAIVGQLFESTGSVYLVKGKCIQSRKGNSVGSEIFQRSENKVLPFKTNLAREKG